jgi:hypothetical protein
VISLSFEAERSSRAGASNTASRRRFLQGAHAIGRARPMQLGDAVWRGYLARLSD